MKQLTALLISAICFMGAAQAEPVSITNAGFEIPVASPDDTWGSAPTGWTVSGGDTLARVIKPVVNTPNAQEGVQVLGLGANAWVYQDLSENWDSTKDYTLTVYAATPSFSSNKSGIHIDIRNATTNAVIASNDVWLNNPGGPWMAVQVRIMGSSLGANAGNPIRIFIQKPSWSGAGYTFVDNVVLEKRNRVTLMITNAGFESPVCEASDTWGPPPTDWFVPGSGYKNVIKPVVNKPNAYEGLQVLGLNRYAWVYQDLSDTWDASKDYILTVYAATPSFSANRSGIHIAARNATTNEVIASNDVWLNNPGEPWIAVQLTVWGSSLGTNAGSPIRIFIQKPGWSGEGFTFVDNVELVAVQRPTFSSQDGIWNTDASGVWSDSSKWQNGNIAYGANKTASFIADLTAPRTVSLDFFGTIGAMVFQDVASPQSNIGWVVSSDLGTVLAMSNTATPSITVGTTAIENALVSLSIGGSQGLEKKGPGLLTLTGNNTYTGQTTISNGVLRISHLYGLGASGAGNGTTVLSGAALELLDPPGSNFHLESLTLNGTGIGNTGALRAITGSGDNHMAWNGPITLGSNAAIGVDSGAQLVLQAPIAGSYDLTKVGNGYLYVDVNCPDFTGNFIIAQGRVRFSDVNRMNSCASLTISNGGELQLDCNGERTPDGNYPTYIVGAGADGLGALKVVGSKQVAWTNITLMGDTTVRATGSGGLYLGNLIGSATLIKTGTSLLDLELLSPNYTGNIICQEGRLQWRHYPTAPGTAAGNTTLWNGTGLTLVTDPVNGDPSYIHGGSPTAIDLTYAEPLVIGGGPSTAVVYLQKITYPKDYANNDRGNVKDTITGSITLNTSLRVDVVPAGWERAYEDCLTLSGTISGIGDITKTGIGVLEITGNNTRTGNTIINGGTLRLTGTNNKLPDNGILQVAAGAKVELGSGVNETVGSLVLDGVVQPAGTYNASNTPAYFTGSGNLIVSSGATLAGTVVLGDWIPGPADTPVTVNIGASVYQARLDSDGKFVVSTPGTGTYNVRVRADGWLAKKQTGVVISSGSNTVGTAFELTNGDCSVDNKINLHDFAILAGDWSVSEDGLAADLNGSGTVDMDDLLILTKSWLMAGDTI